MRGKNVLAASLAVMLSLTGMTATAHAAESEKEPIEAVVAEGAVYSAKEAYINGDYMIFAVYADSTGDYEVNFVATEETAGDLEIAVNGIPYENIRIPSEGNVLSLHKGINTIKLAYTDALAAIALPDGAVRETRGVTASYVTYEAEECETNATVLEDSRVYHEIASEASGRRAVQLDGTGEYVKLVLKEDANAITLRTCVPDNAEGTGESYTLTVTVGGDAVEMTVDSYHTWVYGDYPFVNTPEEGTEHNFFDDTSLVLDKTYPAGTEVIISKEAADEAVFYFVDLIETELVEEALPQPENSISIVAYGAVADDGEDDTQALLDTIEAAVAEGKEVWLPAGTFHFTESRIVIQNDNVTIRGAGMWHTVITGDYAAFLVKANNAAFYDFKMEGTAVVRRDDVDPAAFEVASSVQPKENLTIQNIWVEHYKVGAWTYNISGVHMVGCRIRNTFADGINLCKASCNSMVEQCSFRGTGDDSVAMWSQTYCDVNNTVRYNTISAPDLANCVAIYGGKDITICDNIISDVITEGSGINISTNFSPAEFGEKIIVERNTLLRAGSKNDTSGAQIGAIWFNTVKDFSNGAEVIVRDNEIYDSSYQGIFFGGLGEVAEVLVECNTIENSGTWAVEASSFAKCTVSFRNNVMSDNAEGDVNSRDGVNVVFNMDVLDEPVAEDGTIEQPVTEEESNMNSVAMVVAVFVVVIVGGISIVTILFKKNGEKRRPQNETDK